MLRQLRCSIPSVPRLQWKHSFITFIIFGPMQVHVQTYLLGLLAMIKCSICSYQCDNWYVSNWRLACHIYFSLGKCALELAQGPSRVALAWHIAGGSSPFGVTNARLLSAFWHNASWLCLVVPLCCLIENTRIFTQLILVFVGKHNRPSQRSLHNAPIFRLLLKVAVNGTHQCDFINFCGALWVPTMLCGCQPLYSKYLLVIMVTCCKGRAFPDHWHACV